MDAIVFLGAIGLASWAIYDHYARNSGDQLDNRPRVYNAAFTRPSQRLFSGVRGASESLQREIDRGIGLIAGAAEREEDERDDQTREVPSSQALTGRSDMRHAPKCVSQWPAWAPEPLSAAKYIAADHYTRVKPGEWPAKHFTPQEIATPWNGANGSLIINRQALSKLEALRGRMGRPLKVNSGYRDPQKNARLSGAASQSRHQLGWAFDISTAGMTQNERKKLYLSAKQIGFKGFGFYNAFLHVDIGQAREWNTKYKRLFV